MNKKSICIILCAIICVCGLLAACSGKNHSGNEKTVTNDSTPVVTQAVTDKNGKVVGTRVAREDETVTGKNGEVMVKKIETVTDKGGKKVTKVVTEKITDKSGKEVTVNTKETKKSNKDTTKKNDGDKKTTKKKVTTTTDPCTTTKPDDPIILPDTPEDGYKLSASLGQYILQEKIGRDYVVNTDSVDGDKVVYKIYTEKKHELYSTVKANIKTGNATEINEKTGKKTKYNIAEIKLD